MAHTNASDHHWYEGSPRRGTPPEPLSVLLISSGTVKRLTRAVARVIGSLEVSQTVFPFNGARLQSGKLYEATDAIRAANTANCFNAIVDVCCNKTYSGILLVPSFKILRRGPFIPTTPKARPATREIVRKQKIPPTCVILLV